jgi:uncharacterized phosphosugar-binding protein
MKHKEYYEVLKQQLDRQVNEEIDNIELAAQICAKSIMNGRVVHAFGCGHSQMFAMELFYRAGGLVPINTLLIPQFALFPKAKLSTLQERMEGYMEGYLDLVNTSEDDTMIIVSISGRNAAVIDLALASKKVGMKVIALVSEEFSSSVTSRHSSGKNLKDFADVVIDVKCVAGDACLSMEGMEHKFSGTSTILGMTALNCMSSRVIEICVENGFEPPVFVSGNLDKGDKINNEHIKKYGHLVDCL